MVVEDMGDGYFKLTAPGSKVRDKRTGRKYKTVVCSERNVQYFEAV